MTKTRFGGFFAALLLTAALATTTVAAQTKSTTSTTSTTKAAPLLDINSATVAQLHELGIGNAHAKKIIAGRPYKSTDELVSKKILTQAKFNTIKDKIVVKQAKTK